MKKNAALFLLLATFAGSVIAEPSDADIKQWLDGKEASVEKRWYWFDRTVTLKSYTITDIKVIECNETRKVKPWEQNIGTAKTSFIYRDGGANYKFEAVFTYTFEGILSRANKLETPPMITRK